MLRYNHVLLHCYFFTLIIMTPISLVGMYNGVALTPIPNTPHYKKLTEKFGALALSTVLYSYQNNAYVQNQDFQNWSFVADSVIGQNCVEEQRRDFLINVMLHTQNNSSGLGILYHAFCHKSNINIKPDDTPQGPVHSRLLPLHYQDAMNVPEDIRTKIFSHKDHNALVLVKKSNSLLSNIKWPLYKGVGLIAHLIARCLEKENQNNTEKDKTKKDDNSFASFLALTDICQETETEIQAALEKTYPCLKEYEVKSLLGDRISWIYNRNNWILCGSIGCMAILLLCLMRDKLPSMHQAISFIVIF